jgi:hypothetical protein
MNNYKIISDKDNIILKKNDNKFKLDSKSKVKKKCNIIELAENYEIYNLFKLLNEKLIHKLKIIKKDNSEKKNEVDIIIFFNNIMKNDEDSDDEDNKNYYISFTNIINKKSENSITLLGNKNHISIDKDNYKKMDIDNISLNIDLVNDELEINLSFEYVGEKILIIMENTLGLVFRKIIKNLILYYSE